MTTQYNPKGGPRTPEGKLKSSLNALKHGLTAQSSHALNQLNEEFNINTEAIHQRIRDYYKPTDPLEDELVKRIADCLCRLERTRAMENRMDSRTQDPVKPNKSYERLLRYERSVDVHLHRAIAAIERKREKDKKNAQNELL